MIEKMSRRTITTRDAISEFSEKDLKGDPPHNAVQPTRLLYSSVICHP